MAFTESRDDKILTYAVTRHAPALPLA